MFAGGVDRRSRAALMSKGRGDVDNAAGALRHHAAQFMLPAEDRAQHIGVESRGMAFRGLLGGRAGLALGAGGVDRDIKAAEALHGLVDQSANVILMTDVRANEMGFRASGG